MSFNGPAWEGKLRDMAKYYNVCLNNGNVRQFLNRYPVKNSSGDVDPEVRDKLKQLGGESIAEHKDATDEIHNIIEELKKEQNPDKGVWKERVKDKYDELKRKSQEIIDQKTDEAIDYIYTLPDQERDTAAEFWALIISGFVQFWADAWESIGTVASAVAEWANDMWDTIDNAFKEVEKAFANAWEWLKNVF